MIVWVFLICVVGEFGTLFYTLFWCEVSLNAHNPVTFQKSLGNFLNLDSSRDGKCTWPKSTDWKHQKENTTRFDSIWLRLLRVEITNLPHCVNQHTHAATYNFD